MSEVRHEAGRSAFMRKWEKFVRGERLRLNLMMLPGVVFVFLFNMMTLLGIALHQGTSFPVGKVDFLKLYPL